MFTTFYHGTIRKIVTAFGTLFNNIYIERVDGATIKKIKIPLIYSGKEKFIYRLNFNTDKTQVQTILPRIGFNIISFTYDSERKKNSINRRYKEQVNTDNDVSFQYRYEDVPYNIEFELNIYARNMDDGLQIIEQILPFFTPEFTITIKPKILNTSNEKIDIPIVLNTITPSETYDGTFKDDTRLLTWDLAFTAKTFLYGPVKQAGLIKDININFFDFEEI